MAKGKVAQVIGTVVDIEFSPDELPTGCDAWHYHLLMVWSGVPKL